MRSPILSIVAGVFVLCLSPAYAQQTTASFGGNVTDEAIAEYIRLQGAEPQNDDRFQVSE